MKTIYLQVLQEQLTSGQMLNLVKESPPRNMLRDSHTQISRMNSVEPDDESLTRKPDHQIVLNFQVRGLNNTHFFNPELYPFGGRSYQQMFSTQINGISNMLPPVPLLTQTSEVDQV